jgi:hypothetical protein
LSLLNSEALLLGKYNDKNQFPNLPADSALESLSKAGKEFC